MRVEKTSPSDLVGDDERLPIGSCQEAIGLVIPDEPVSRGVISQFPSQPEGKVGQDAVSGRKHSVLESRRQDLRTPCPYGIDKISEVIQVLQNSLIRFGFRVSPQKELVLAAIALGQLAGRLLRSATLTRLQMEVSLAPVEALCQFVEPPEPGIGVAVSSRPHSPLS